MEKINILVTSAGRRVSLVRSFKSELRKVEPLGKVYCTDLFPKLSSACQVSDGAFPVVKVTHENYIQNLLTICLENRIALIIPTIDSELEVLSKNRLFFLKYGIKSVISDFEFIKKCRNKRLIHDFFDSLDITRAKEYIQSNLRYPVFVKPFDGSRSQGIHLLNSKAQLTDKIIANKGNMFLEYVNPEKFKEFTVDIYFNKDSKILSVVPRERIFIRDGEVNKACTRKNSIIAYVREKFENVSGLRGCITLQVFKKKDEDSIIAIEINPRFGGGYPLSYEAGSNFPKWIIEEYLLNIKLNQYKEDWKPNLLMLRYDHEILVDDYTS